MKIALVGFGNMGKEVERLIAEDGKHEVVSISFKQKEDKLDLEGIKKADVILDFTSAEVVLENIKKVAGLGKNIVVGTTGWYEHLDEVKKIVKKNGIGLIYSGNFSIGANIFFKIIAFSSKLFAKFGGYDVYGFEIHHTGKKDSPSGTALRIAKEIMGSFSSKKKIQSQKLDRKINADELHFASVRGGRNPGFHQVVFDSSADSVSLSHQAHSRAGFGLGAILAAEYIKGKKGLHTFDEIFERGVK